ncbi:hAT family dimerization domain protein [Ilyonectria robusta]
MSANQPGQQHHLEDRLFRHFRGWTWSERARDTSSWLWDFGYDIQRHGLRKWACKDCVLRNRPIIASFTSSGLQNAANHLWREHKTPAPEGEKKSTAQLKSQGALKSNQPTIASVLKLDVNKPTEQNIANSFISRFDKQHFQRMLVELIVSSNQSFSFAENPILREIFDYLNPSVSIQRANLSATAVRYKIIQEYNRHKQTVIETVVKTLEGDGHIRRRKQGWTGSYGNIWDVVLGYELLLNTLEEYKQLAANFPDTEHFRIGINLAWDKLDEYYRRLDETPIYYTAIALHPAYRWDWFDETWAHKPSWVEKAKEMVADVWLSDYAHFEVRSSSSRGDDEPPAKRPRFFNPFEKNSRLPSSTPTSAAAIVGDEYQAWQTDREASDGDVLRSWYRAGLIKDLDPLLKSHVESKLDAGCGTLSDDELALAESKWLFEGEDSASEVDDSSQQQEAEELVSTSESEAE